MFPFLALRKEWFTLLKFDFGVNKPLYEQYLRGETDFALFLNVQFQKIFLLVGK